MKKIITSAFFAFALFVSVANAQGELSIHDQATHIARQMLTEVQLNESEYIRVRNFTIEKMRKAIEIKQMYSNDPVMLQSKLAEAENNYNHNLKEVLSPRQYDNYLAYNARLAGTQVASATEE